ncbi:hypothetical protein BLNAU_13576 [Blattamonas nauphoetae]|uniref:Trichohyalin n=1 Tax=Blattamonas nauphoetae TaxID=2049346 RepID=A0ABQ9XIX7_9EUKA|nr:hypothetical protein BLNAU_13576 [Blattamonas nauphoetae]
MLQTQIGDLKLQQELFQRETEAKLQKSVAEKTSELSERERQKNKDLSLLKEHIKSLEIEKDTVTQDLNHQLEIALSELEEEKKRHSRAKQVISDHEETLSDLKHQCETLHAELLQSTMNLEHSTDEIQTIYLQNQQLIQKEEFFTEENERLSHELVLLRNMHEEQLRIQDTTSNDYQQTLSRLQSDVEKLTKEQQDEMKRHVEEVLRLKDEHENAIISLRNSLEQQRDQMVSEITQKMESAEIDHSNLVLELQKKAQEEIQKYQDDQHVLEQSYQQQIADIQTENADQFEKFKQDTKYKQDTERKERERMLVEITTTFEEKIRGLREQSSAEQESLRQQLEEALQTEKDSHSQDISILQRQLDTETSERAREREELRKEKAQSEDQTHTRHKDEVLRLKETLEKRIEDLEAEKNRLEDRLQHLDEERTRESKERMDREDAERRQVLLEREEERKKYELIMEEMRREQEQQKQQAEQDTARMVSEMNAKWKEEVEELRREKEQERIKFLEEQRQQEKEKEANDRLRAADVDDKHEKRIKSLKKELSALVNEEKKKYEALQQKMDEMQKAWTAKEKEMRAEEDQKKEELRRHLAEAEEQIGKMRLQFAETIRQRDDKTHALMNTQAKNWEDAIRTKEKEVEMWRTEAKELEEKAHREREALEKASTATLDKANDEKRRVSQENEKLKRNLEDLEAKLKEEREKWKDESQRRTREEERKENEWKHRLQRAENLHSSLRVDASPKQLDTSQSRRTWGRSSQLEKDEQDGDDDGTEHLSDSLSGSFGVRNEVGARRYGQTALSGLSLSSTPPRGYSLYTSPYHGSVAQSVRSGHAPRSVQFTPPSGSSRDQHQGRETHGEGLGHNRQSYSSVESSEAPQSGSS